MFSLPLDSEGAPTGTGVQPPATVPSGQMPPFPIYVIPYPLPIVPSPGSCPCYLLNPGQNGTTTQGQVSPPPNYQNQPQYAPYGIIGFVPVVFMPYCPGNGSTMNSAQQNFPNAVPMQYNCAQCQANSDIYRYLGRQSGGRSTGFKDLKEIKSLSELEDLLRNQIKPLKKSVRTIGANPRILDDPKTENDKSEKKNAKKTEKNKQ